MSNTPAKVEVTQTERFSNEIMRQFAASVPSQLEGLTPFQRRLSQSYFITIDAALKKAEQKRLSTDEKKRDSLPVTWQNVNMEELARKLISYSRIGLDPAQSNHINLIPYKNNRTQQYDVTFMEGYRGMEIKAKKYGLDFPDDVVIELVYSNDEFILYKKDNVYDEDNYNFTIKDAFDRGDIKGGFYCHKYSDNPSKNKVVVLTLHDIEKRKPKYASSEFWGGEKTVWKNGKAVGKEQTEGWFPEMCYKTIYRAAYNDVTIDSAKIDDDFLQIIHDAEDQGADKALPQSNSVKLEDVRPNVGFEAEKTTPEKVSVTHNNEAEKTATPLKRAF